MKSPHSVLHSPQKRIIFLVSSFWLLVTLAGCAAITEGLKGFLGISTRQLEIGRQSAIVKNFPYDYFSCFTKTLDTLKGQNSYIYKQNIRQKMIAIYLSEQDTTPVGIFFQEIDASHTRLEISSPSSSAKELIAQKLFSTLEEKAKTNKNEAVDE